MNDQHPMMNEYSILNIWNRSCINIKINANDQNTKVNLKDLYPNLIAELSD